MGVLRVVGNGAITVFVSNIINIIIVITNIIIVIILIVKYCYLLYADNL